MQPPTVDRFPIPYDLSFIGKIALDAYARQDEVEEIASRHRLLSSQVNAWRSELARNASALMYAPTPSIEQSDVRIAALEQMNVCMAVLEGDELRYRYANASYLVTAGGKDILGK